MPMGMADVATVLFGKHLKFDAAAPDWPDRDRFILSAGHGSMLLYGLLHLTGYEGHDARRDRGTSANGARKPPAIPKTSTPRASRPRPARSARASPIRVGFAIAEEALRARFGPRLVDHHTWVIAGDGCLMEGISHEAIGLAGKQQLSNLIVLWDDNGISIDGKVSLADITDQKARFAASGWDVLACDGHDPEDIDRALTAAKAATRPVMVACKTHIGFGAPTKQDTNKAHGSPLGRRGDRQGARDLWLDPGRRSKSPPISEGGMGGDRRPRAWPSARHWEARLRRPVRRPARPSSSA